MIENDDERAGVEAYAKTDPRPPRERQGVFPQMRVLEEARWPPGVGLGIQFRASREEGRGHAHVCLLRALVRG